jgi:hypothetical protein
MMSRIEAKIDLKEQTRNSYLVSHTLLHSNSQTLSIST